MGVILLLLAASALPCGEGQQSPSQNQPQQNTASQAAYPVAPATQSSDSSQDQRMARESADLLKLATDLKTEVDKSTKDTLSLSVIRKAEEIERVARSMKDRYRVSAAAN